MSIQSFSKASTKLFVQVIIFIQQRKQPRWIGMSSSGMMISDGIKWMISIGIWLNTQTKSILVYLDRVQLIESVNLNKIRIEAGLCFIVLFVKSKLFATSLPVKSYLLRTVLHQQCHITYHGETYHKQKSTTETQSHYRIRKTALLLLNQKIAGK